MSNLISEVLVKIYVGHNFFVVFIETGNLETVEMRKKKKKKNHQSSHFLLIHKKKKIFVNYFPELQIKLNYVNSKKKKKNRQQILYK